MSTGSLDDDSGSEGVSTTGHPENNVPIFGKDDIDTDIIDDWINGDTVIN